MKVVINKYTKEIEFLSHHAEFAETNINVAGTFIAGADRFEIFDISETIVPNDFKPFKYRYINGVLKKNVGYKEDNVEIELASLKGLFTEQEKRFKEQMLKTKEQSDIIDDLLIAMLMM